MVRSSGPQASMERDHSVPRALQAQRDQMPPQVMCSSLVSLQAQYNYNMNLLGNTSNYSTIESGDSSSNFPCSSASKRASVDAMPKDSDQQTRRVGQFQQLEFQQPMMHYCHVQQHVQSSQGGLGGATPGRSQPRFINDLTGQHQQFNSIHSPGPVKLEQTEDQVGMGIGPDKGEQQYSDQPELKELQQFLQWSMQSSQAASSQLNPYQHEHLKCLPQQGPQLQQQLIRSTRGPMYEPGMCAQRLSQYMFQQKNRPNNNSIAFWNNFVAEFFTPIAKKRWCFSLYQNGGQVYGPFNQDFWSCQICKQKPGRGFETTFEALPRLFKMKYDSGTLEELLSIDMPREYPTSSGHIILEYAKARQESVFEQLRIDHDGQLRIVFSSDLKICSWEFCARSHEVLIPRRSIMPQVCELEAAACNYQSCALSAFSNVSMQDLESSCNMFGESALELQKALEVPARLTKIGYMQDYGRCLQISDTFCRMKGLIDYSQETGKGPIECYANFLKHGFESSAQNPEERQQNIGESSMNGHQQANALQSSESNVNLRRTSHGMMPTYTSFNTADKFLLPKLKNSLREIQTSNPISPYIGTAIPSSTGSSSNNLSCATQRILAPRAATNYRGAVNSPAQTQLHTSSRFNNADQNESQIKQEAESSSEDGDPGSMVRDGSAGNKIKMSQLTKISKTFRTHWNSLSSGNGK